MLNYSFNDFPVVLVYVNENAKVDWIEYHIYYPDKHTIIVGQNICPI